VSGASKVYNSLRRKAVKPLSRGVRLIRRKAKEGREMYEWTFSSTAEWVVGALLVVVLVAAMLV